MRLLQKYMAAMTKGGSLNFMSNRVKIKLIFSMNFSKLPAFIGLLLSTATVAQRPVLVVPTIHTSHIEYLSVTPGLPYLVSAAEDVVKIWETETGKLIRSVPAVKGEGFAAAALSPDAKWLATAGNSYERDMRPTVAPMLQLWDPQTGTRIRQLHAFALGERVIDLRFSPHRRYLMAVVLRNGWNLSTVLFDPETGEKRLSLPGIGSFAKSGEQVVLCQNEAVVLADIGAGTTLTVLAEPCFLAEEIGDTLHLLTKMGSLLRWSLASQSIISSFTGILDEEQRHVLDTYAGRGRAQFSADGKRLIVYEPEGITPEDEWGEQSYRFRTLSTATGQLEYYTPAGSRSSWTQRRGIYTPDLAYFLTAPITAENVDNRSVVEAQVTSTGKVTHTFGLKAFEQVTWANKYSELDIHVYSNGELIVVRGRSFGGQAGIFYTRLGQSIPIWEEQLDAFLKKNKHVRDERWRIVCEDYLSYQIIEARTSAIIANLLFSENALEDDDAIPNRTWAVTTPSGLFDASPDMMEDLHFVTGLEIIELEQLKERYYEPGLLSKLMGLSREPLRSVTAFEDIALYPIIELRLDSLQQRLHIALQPRDGGMGKLSVFANGKEIIEDALQGVGPDRSRDTSLTLDLAPFARYFIAGTLNTITVRAYNRENWLRSPLRSVTFFPDFVSAKGEIGQTSRLTSSKKSRNPALHLLLVGVADYAGAALDLKYTAKDAEDMASALQQAGGELFGADSVFVHLISTTPGMLQPTKANIKAAFDSIAAKAKAEDVLLAYFSGHGVNYGEAEKSLFYFLTMETGSFDLSDPGIRAARAISSDELTHWVNSAAAQKQVLIIDACNSGKLLEDLGAGGKSLTASQIRALELIKDRTGMFILSGSAADQKSFEASKFRQSLLTYSLLEAMQGAALNLDKDIDVMRLFDQARTRVRELAAELELVQEPVPNYPRNAGTIFIGRVNEKVKIELARAGAVFISSVFQDEAQFNDLLGLADAVNNYLREENAAGADFLFFDLKNIPDAYSIHGRYILTGDSVTVRARLFKGKTGVGEAFSVAGNKDDLSVLVAGIIMKVQDILKKVQEMERKKAEGMRK